MTEECQNDEFHPNRYQNSRRTKDMELLSFGGIEDPFNENEFRNNYKQFTANSNASVIAPQISPNLLIDSPRRPKFIFPKKKKHSSKRHHEVSDEPSTDKKHNKPNENTSIISNIFNFGKGRSRANSVRNDKHPLSIVIESSSHESSDNENKSKSNSSDNESEHHKRRKLFFRDGKRKAENTKSIQPERRKSITPVTPTSNNVISQNEPRKIDVKSILKNELLDHQNRKHLDSLYINVNSNSIDSFFSEADDQIVKIFDQYEIDSTGIENSKIVLKRQINSTAKSLSLTSEKVNGLYIKFATLKNAINDTTENINRTHQKADFLHDKIKNLVHDFRTDLNDSNIEIDESWFDSYGNHSNQDAYQPKQQSFLSIIYLCFIAFINFCIDSLKGINLSRFETSPNKKKSKKGAKKRKTKSKNINKMIRIVKFDSTD